MDLVKSFLPRGTKIGHAGTLDPFATGALVLLVGKGTKLCERLMDAPKQYVARARLGATTATDDLDSPEGVRRAAECVISLLARIPSTGRAGLNVKVAKAIDRLSERLKVPVEDLRSLLRSQRRPKPAAKSGGRAPARS